MPELPDVEAMRQYVESTSLHQEIGDVDIRAPILMPHADTATGAAAREVEEKLIGRCFDSARRHGKYLFVLLDEEGHSIDDVLLLHFAMTGGLEYFKRPDDEPDYSRVLIHFVNGYQLAYVSQRKLGRVEVINDVERFVEAQGLGPDALDPDFDFEAFQAAVDGRRAMVKAVLMEQETMAGIGNVYADEILFQAGIHPRTKISKLSGDELEDLFHKMKDVLKTAIERQGDPERLPSCFVGPHRHEEGRCPRCGAALERVKVSSRTSYLCPECQERR